MCGCVEIHLREKGFPEGQSAGLAALCQHPFQPAPTAFARREAHSFYVHAPRVPQVPNLAGKCILFLDKMECMRYDDKDLKLDGFSEGETQWDCINK